jgi:hypothetical protein
MSLVRCVVNQAHFACSSGASQSAHGIARDPSDAVHLSRLRKRGEQFATSSASLDVQHELEPIKTVLCLANALETAQFKRFWKDRADVKLLDGLSGFDDAIRECRHERAPVHFYASLSLSYRSDGLLHVQVVVC